MSLSTPVRLAALAALGLTVVVGPAPPSGAAGDFSATAAADGIRVGIAMPGFLVVEQFVDVGVPSAQAHVDSLGNSRAWAANPFPGDTVVSTPGTVAGFGPPGLPALPPYPLIATATHPTQRSGEVSGPGFLLRSQAEPEAASGIAESGVTGEGVTVGLVRAAADVRRGAEGATRAVGRTSVEAFVVRDILHIGRVDSSAMAEVAPDATPTRRATTTIAEVTVSGQKVVVDERGITVPGGASPLPATDPLRAALVEAGITVRYLAPQQSDDGVVAAGVEVTVARDVPSVGTGVVTYVLGRAAAFAVADTDPAGGFPPDTVTAPPVPSAAALEGTPHSARAEDAPATAASVVAPVAPIPASPVATGRFPAAITPPAGPASGAVAVGADVAAAAPAAPAPAPVITPSRQAAAVAAGPDFSGFAPVLAAGGLMVAVALLLTHRAMRSASWTS